MVARFAGVATHIGGALIGVATLGGNDGQEGLALLAVSWSCAGVMALGAPPFCHPLFGKALGSIGVAVRLLTVGWSGSSLPEGSDVRGLLHPITLLAV